MSQNRSDGGLNESDQCYFKVYKIVVSEARIILYHIFLWGCPRDLTKSFEIHAKEKLGMSNKLFKNLFDNSMQVKMKSNPSGNEFDVSLLNACIMHACPDLKKEEKEEHIKPIKDFRNNLIHSTVVENAATMDALISQLREMLIKAIMKARDVYERPQSETDDIIKQMDMKIQEIKECSLPIFSVDKYREEIRILREANKTLVQDKGVTSLKENFKEVSNVDPASWLTGKDRLDVKEVFTRLDIIAITGNENSHYSIGHEKLLELKCGDEEHPTIIIVVGDAGSGKSTLAKFVLKSWADIDEDNPVSSIEGLEKYQLVLYIECRNKSISSFQELLSTSMPQVWDQMTDEEFIKAVLALKTLVIVDGLDEMRGTSNAEKLIKEMFEKYVPMSQGNLHFLMTTRPQKMNVTLFGKHSQVHAKLKGIPPERRVELVEKLHDAMIQKGISKQNTSKLVDYVKQSQSRLGEHYRLPLNLTLLTYLWAEDPDNINSITSATRLYVAVLRLLKLRLTSRIDDAIVSTEGLEDRIEEYVKVLFEVYLKTHVAGDIQISKESFDKLEQKSKDLHLPLTEMVSPFFAVDTEWTPYGNQVYLSAPHKSIMEFFCAFQIFNSLTCDTEQKRLATNIEELRVKFANSKECNEMMMKMLEAAQNQTLKDILQDSLREENSDYIDYAEHHNVLLHLGGLMALKDLKVLHKNGSILVDCLDKGEVNADQWLDLVAESECDPELASLVAKKIMGKLVVRDGHTLAAMQMFENLDTNVPVQVIFECEVKYIPEIGTFMDRLSERECDVELLLKNHWKNPWNGNSTEHLKKLFDGNCTVTRFTGNVDDLNVLPSDANDLRLTIADDKQADQIFSKLSELEKRITFEYLGIHIIKDVLPSLLKPFPVVKPQKNECGTVWISDIGNEDIKKACDIVSALLPPKMQFNSIMFPRSHLSKKEFQELLQDFKDRGVRVSRKGGVKTDSTSIDNISAKALRDFTRVTLDCEFYWGDERSVW